MSSLVAMLLVSEFSSAATVAIVRSLPYAEGGGVVLYSGGAFNNSGRDPKLLYAGRAPDFVNLPRKEFGGRPAFPVSPDARMTIEGTGFKRTYKVWTDDGELRHSFEMNGFNMPVVHSLNHIVLGDRNQWILNGKTVDFPTYPNPQNLVYSLVGPNQRRSIAFIHTNWRDPNPAPSAVRSAFTFWSPGRGFTPVKPPKGYLQVFALGLNDNDWVPVRASNDPLNMHPDQALTGSIQSREGEIMVPGVPRFWRDGVYAGATPPALPVPKAVAERTQIVQDHFAQQKWGPLEIYFSNAYPFFREEAKDQFYAGRVRWRLHGQWRTLKQLVPEWKGNEADVRFAGGSGGYLFLQDEAARQITILKIPEAWLDMPR